MSNLSAFPYIAERSEGTPGLWNYPLSIISANIAAIDSGLTLSSPSGNTFSVLTNLETSGGAHFQFLSIGSTPPSYATTAGITVRVNSGTSDYLYLSDSAAQRSSYVIGSRAGATGDGLNIWDASAGTLIVSFSKQSTRFYAPVVGAITDIGGAIFNVTSYGALGDGVSNDRAAIQATLDAASANGGGTAFFPNGTYFISSALTLRNRVSLLGAGRGAQISLSSQSQDMFKGSVVGDLRISSIYFNGPGNDQTDSGDDGGNGFNLSQCSQVGISNCWFERFDDCVIASNCTALEINNNFFRKYSGAAARLLNVMDSGFAQNQCNGDRRGVGSGQSAVNGVWLSSTGNGYTNNCVIANNEIRNTSFECILVIAHHCAIVGNTCFDALDGINCQTGSDETQQPTVGGSFNVVVGNVLRQQVGLGSGIRIGNSSGQNTVSGHDNLISGNQVDTTTGVGMDLTLDAFNNVVAHNYLINNSSHGIASGVSANYNQFIGNSIYSARGHGMLIQGGTGNLISNNIIRSSLQNGLRVVGTSNNLHITGNLVFDSDVSTSGSWANIEIAPSGSITTISLMGNRCFNTIAGSFANQGIAVGGASTATNVSLIGNDCRGNKAATNGINVNANPTCFLFGNLEGSNTTGVEERSMVGDGVALGPGLAFSSEVSLGLYRSAASSMGMSYGQFQLVAGTSLLPGLGFSSETSLGLYRSATSILALSYGQLGLPSGTAAAPSMAFAGDTDTGIYRVASNFLAIAAGGGDGLYVTNLQIRFPGTGSQNTPTVAWNSESSLGFYRSGVSTVGLSYGAFQVPDGSSTTPSLGYSSNSSLGFYSSGVQTIAQSYGTFDLTATIASLGTIRVKSGANNSCGTAVLGSNGSVNVANTYVKTGDLIFLTDQTAGGTLGDLELGGIRNSSGFTILSTSLTDTSTVAWLIVRPG